MAKVKPPKHPPFVPLLHQTMDTPGWLALSPWAKALYPFLKRRAGYNGNRNGSFSCSVREAAEYLKCHRDTAAEALADLQRKGLSVAVHIGCLGVSGEGKATTWRLTELGTPSVSRPTKEFAAWHPGADHPVAKGKAPPRRK
jgi:hypothetical protein